MFERHSLDVYLSLISTPSHPQKNIIIDSSQLKNFESNHGNKKKFNSNVEIAYQSHGILMHCNMQ